MDLRKWLIGLSAGGVVVAGAAAGGSSAPPRAAEAGGGEALPFVVTEADRPEEAAIRQWFGELDDPDATVRERARVSLMGMKARDLPAFQRLVRDNRPLMPAQAAALRQVVMHVYLAGERYETAGTEGFLGVKMQDTTVRVPAADGADQPTPRLGITIVERIPGFAGFRALLDGDVILGIHERPDIRTPGMVEFMALIQSIAPGTTLNLQVLRQGQITRIPVTLGPRPLEAEHQGRLEIMIMGRDERAREYWNQNFAGLTKERVG